MLFNSYLFIFLFFPLCLTGFYLLEKKGRAMAAKIWLTGFSLWFYGYFNLYYLGIMVGSILFNYCAFRLIWRLGGQEDARRNGRQVSHDRPETAQLSQGRAPAVSRIVLAVGICANLAVLFYFKYYDFFVENINVIFHAGFGLKRLLLPLGISFFTFQQIGFLVDAYRGEAKKCSPVEYALFVSFFPQLIAGPIVSYAEMMPQFERIGHRQFSWEKLVKGLYLFTLGMAKKVLIADTFGLAVDYGYGNIASLNGVEAVLVMLFYTLQLYFDFSGYCDMARGLGWMLGIEIPVNFNSPYKASNIIDFWKRWHITLNRFLTKYVYIPLGGNRKGFVRMLCNLMIVFLVSGFWHGAGWTFVIWGAMHGIAYVGTRIVQRQKKSGAVKKSSDRTGLWQKAVHVCSVFATFLFVNAAWVFFRAQNLSSAMELFGRMGKGGFGLPSLGIYDGFNLDEFWYVMKVLHLTNLPHADMYLLIAFTLAALAAVFFHKNAGEMAEQFVPKASNMLASAVLFVWCVLSLSGVSTFLYFNF